MHVLVRSWKRKSVLFQLVRVTKSTYTCVSLLTTAPWFLLFMTSIVQQNTDILSWYTKQDCLSFQPTEAYLRVQVCPKVEHKWRASHSLKSTLMSTSYEEYTLKQSCVEYTRPRRHGTDHVLILYVLACVSLHSPTHRRGAHHVLVSTLPFPDVEHTMCLYYTYYLVLVSTLPFTDVEHTMC